MKFITAFSVLALACPAVAGEQVRPVERPNLLLFESDNARVVLMQRDDGEIKLAESFGEYSANGVLTQATLEEIADNETTVEAVYDYTLLYGDKVVKITNPVTFAPDSHGDVVVWLLGAPVQPVLVSAYFANESVGG